MPLSNVIPIASRAPAPLHERSDDELMVLAQAGVRDAFACLAKRHMARLTNYCARMTGNARIAEEIAQETWLHIWSHRANYVPSGKFAIFLYSAARNRCRNHARDTRRHSLWDAGANAADIEAFGTPPEQLDELLNRERCRRTHLAVQALPTKLQEAVILRYSEELEYEQISELLDEEESTIRSRVFYGLKKLRTHLSKGAT